MKTKEKIIKLLKNEIKNRLLEKNKYNWELIGRENQLLPKGNWKIWLLMAGRGFGKTRSGAEAIRKLINNLGYKHIGLVAKTISDAREVMVEGESGLLNISPISEGITFEPSNRLIKWKNKAIARIYSADNVEQLRGPQFDCVWIDELAKFSNPEEVLNQVFLGLRLGTSPKLIITTTPRPIKCLKELIKSKSVILSTGTTYDNAENLPEDFLNHIKNTFEGSALGAQEIYAKILDDNKTWWTYELIESAKNHSIPNTFQDVVVAIDPALTNNQSSDETGIIVVAKDEKGNFFILNDSSGHFDAIDWGRKAVHLYYTYKASCIVIETNAGGDLTEQIIRTFDSVVKIKKVYAKQSKLVRAEAVMSLYQQNRIFHALDLKELEQQMLDYPDIRKSPDRIDALVWGIKELMNCKTRNNFNAFLV